MQKEIKLTSRAESDLEKAEEFYTELYGLEKTEEIILSLFEKIRLLKNPNYEKIGSPDSTFSHLQRTYYKIIHHHFIITYRIGKHTIYIVRVFDTRQNPFKNL